MDVKLEIDLDQTNLLFKECNKMPPNTLSSFSIENYHITFIDLNLEL